MIGEKQMGKVLFLLDELPPTKSANGICINKIIEELNKDGIKSECICWSAPSQYPADVHLIPEKPWKRKVDRFSSDAFLSRLIFQVLRMAYRIKRILLIPIWPVDSCRTVRNYYNMAVQLIDKNTISVVVAVNYPGETLLAMKRLKKRYGDKIRTVMYPLDVSYINPYCGRLERKLSSYFCPKFMKSCSVYADVLLTLENALKTYETHYSADERSNFRLCGIPMLEPREMENDPATPDEIHFLYSGTLQKQVRDPDLAFSVINKIAQNTASRVYFDLCGQIDNQSKQSYQKAKTMFELVEHGWVQEKQLRTFLRKADVLISLGNTESHLIPSKLFTYMATGKPIIHFCITEEDPCISYLKRYGNAYIMFASDVLNIVKLDELYHFIANRHSTSIDLRKIFPRCFPDYTAKILEEMM